MPVIIGINPIIEALSSEQTVEKIYIQVGKSNPGINEIYHLAKKCRIPIVRIDKKKMQKFSPGSKHQGVAALISPITYSHIEDFLDKIYGSGQTANILILDKINDPHNFGAIIRSAEALGSHGLIFELRNSAPITEVVIKSSAGAIFNLELCRVGNLGNAIEYLKLNDFWIYASSSHAKKRLWEVDFSRNQAIVIGSENRGIRPGILKKCDEIFCIPQLGKIESLNVSVATGIILSEVIRQRSSGRK